MYGRKKYTKTNKPVRRLLKSKTRAVARRSARCRYAQVSPIRQMWKNPLPQKAYYKFKYADTDFTLSPAVGNGYFALHVFRGNDLFDPDYTGVGVQPYGVDNYFGIDHPFSRFNVSSSKISIYPTRTDEDRDVPSTYKMIVLPSRLSALSHNGLDDLMQMPKSRMLVSRSNDDYRSKGIHNYATTKFVYANLNPMDASLSGTYAASPTSSWYWHVYVDTTTVPIAMTIKFDVVITYYVMAAKSDNVDES